MPTGIARKKSFHVGAIPNETLSISVCGEKTRNIPTSTSSSCVAKSSSASVMLTPADSLTPMTFTSDSTITTPMPKMMSPGDERSGSQNSPPR